MIYKAEFEICALFFLVVIAVRFLSMRKFQTRINRIFLIIIFGSIVDIVLDIASAYIINNPGTASIGTVYIINTVFYMLQIALSALMLIYTVVLSGVRIKKSTHCLLMIPAAIGELLILTNFLTDLVFYIDGGSCVHGVLFYALYSISGVYLIITAITALKLRKHFRKVEVRTIVFFIIIIIAAIIVQIILPHVLLIGMAMSIAIFLMFISMQNPETMLDTISGTFNYSALNEYLRLRIADNGDIWITAIDIGGIRRINSMMGIRTGNELLEQVGKYINSRCGRRSKAFRMIGTKFVIVSDDPESQKEIVDSLTERFKSPWFRSETGVMLLTTIRYCEEKIVFSLSEDVLNLIDIVYSKTADEGFGTTKAVNAAQLMQFRRKGLIAEALGRALTSGTGFYLVYQPLYSVKEKKFISAEALLRLKDSELGEISPAEFIPVAESTGQIHQIDGMVISLACSYIKKHPELFDHGMHLLEINLSATEFNSDSDHIFNDIIAQISSVEDKICFEVTETAVTTRREILSDFMHRLIGLGVKFALDDYGTGYANIMQLAKLPFSIVKLDRLFVNKKGSKEAMLLHDLVNMFDHIGLTTVLEGVETDEQASFASEIGVEQIQGYYYSKPVDGNELVRLISAQ